MTFSLAEFEKLSALKKSLIFVALTAPLFAVFALFGDLSRGTLVWTFSGALLIALNGHKERTPLRRLGPLAAVLLGLHLPLVIWNPLEHAPFFGGIVTPIVLVDYCADYAFLWLSLRVFRNE